MPQQIIIADDHPLFREALKLALGQVLPGATAHEVDSMDTLLAALNAHPDTDLLVLDLHMPGAYGFSALIQARAHFPAVPVVVVSGREDQSIPERTLQHGAAAFVPKSAPVSTIIEALKTVIAGGVWRTAAPATNGPLGADEADAARRVAKLTPQQFRVLTMLCSGMPNKQIAAQLGVSEATVKAHMTAVMEKLGAANRTQVVLLAQRLALHQLASPADEPG